MLYHYFSVAILDFLDSPFFPITWFYFSPWTSFMLCYSVCALRNITLHLVILPCVWSFAVFMTQSCQFLLPRSYHCPKDRDAWMLEKSLGKTDVIYILPSTQCTQVMMPLSSKNSMLVAPSWAWGLYVSPYLWGMMPFSLQTPGCSSKNSHLKKQNPFLWSCLKLLHSSCEPVRPQVSLPSLFPTLVSQAPEGLDFPPTQRPWYSVDAVQELKPEAHSLLCSAPHGTTVTGVAMFWLSWPQTPCVQQHSVSILKPAFKCHLQVFSVVFATKFESTGGFQDCFI